MLEDTRTYKDFHNTASFLHWVKEKDLARRARIKAEAEAQARLKAEHQAAERIKAAARQAAGA